VIAFVFLVNIAGNRPAGLLSLVMAALETAGIAILGIAAPWSSGFQFAAASQADQSCTTMPPHGIFSKFQASHTKGTS